MVGTFRPRRVLAVALLGALALGLAACGGVYPNSTFNRHTEYNTAIDQLWTILLWLGTAVFIGVEAALIYVIYRFRRRPNAPQPKPIHGSTALEIGWTVLPAVILIFIAIPTVRTIFRTQAKAVPTALQVEAIGHQWWWEFRYPQYGFSTANELYLPMGRTVSFQLKTMDVLHSFWIPQMGGKRDLITNRTNYLWFTPNAGEPSSAWNGACAEFCGASHANMKFRTYTVTQAEFDGWVKNQQADVAFTADPAAAAAPSAPSGTAAPGGTAGGTGAGTTGTGTGATGAVATGATAGTAGATPAAGGAVGARTQARAGARTDSGAARTAVAAQGTAAGTPGAGNVLATPISMTKPAPGQARPPVWMFPASMIEKEFGYTIPKTPIPGGNFYDDNLLPNGNASKGAASAAVCAGCHSFKPGMPTAAQIIIGPTLAHIGSRHTIGAGLYPNDPRHLARWIKNSPMMKPGSKMAVLGKGQIDPATNKPSAMGLLSDEQIADIVAYLQALK